jgi:hypothetical protein
LYGRKVGYSNRFSALAVMQIQQSHFFTVDNPANFFTFLAIFFAVLIATNDAQLHAARNEDEAASKKIRSTGDPLLWYAVGFGISLGMAVASKLNAAPLALLLPAAFAVRHFTCTSAPACELDQRQTTPDANPSNEIWTQITIYLVSAAVSSCADLPHFPTLCIRWLRA